MDEGRLDNSSTDLILGDRSACDKLFTTDLAYLTGLALGGLFVCEEDLAV